MNLKQIVSKPPIRKMKRYIWYLLMFLFYKQTVAQTDILFVKVPLQPWLRRLSSLQQMIKHHIRQPEKQPTNGRAKAKLTLIFTLINVLYSTQKVQTENLDSSKKSVVTSTIMARGFMTL